jgi:hypothetical protein
LTILGPQRSQPFIDPRSLKMVMLRSDDKIWLAFKLNKDQFADIVQRGFLWRTRKGSHTWTGATADC